MYTVRPRPLVNPPLTVGERRVQVSACIDLLCCLNVRHTATTTPAEGGAMASAATAASAETSAASVQKLVFSVVWV